METENNNKGMRFVLIFFMFFSFFVLLNAMLRGIVQPNVFFGVQLEGVMSIIGNIFTIIVPFTIYLFLWYKKNYKTVITLGYLMILNTLLVAAWIFFVPLEQFISINGLQDYSASQISMTQSFMTVFLLLWAGLLLFIFRHVRKHKVYFLE